MQFDSTFDWCIVYNCTQAADAGAHAIQVLVSMVMLIQDVQTTLRQLPG
jgi:hypothetical protein